jgi:hypothetical protein
LGGQRSGEGSGLLISLAIGALRVISRAMHQSRTSESDKPSDDSTDQDPLSQYDPIARERLALAIGSLPTDVVAFVHRLFAHQDSLGGRSILQAVNLASQAGWQAVGIWEDRAIELESDSGERCLLTVLAFSGFDASAGDEKDVERVLDALKGAFGERRFMTAIRRPIPPDFEAEPLARAVSMWIFSLEKGEAQGPHAVYEDDQVSIELTKLAGAPGLSFMIPPCTALERLAIIDRHVLSAMEVYEHAPMPVVIVLANELGWRLPRGYVQQILYGMPDYVVTTNDPEEVGYRVLFQASGSSLFTVESTKNLASLWWLEPDLAEPLTCRAWATDNPWSPKLSRAVGFPGRRLERCDIRGGAAELQWTNYSRLEWGTE